MSEPLRRKEYHITGRVQGVGFRWRARHAAEAAGVTGWVRNEWDGSVSLTLQGTDAQLGRVLQTLYTSPYIEIESLEARAVPPEENERRFAVLDDRW